MFYKVIVGAAVAVIASPLRGRLRLDRPLEANETFVLWRPLVDVR